jgi:hypothetical protein
MATLKTLITGLNTQLAARGLAPLDPKAATEEEINAAFAAIAAPATRAPRAAKFTPAVHVDGAITFAGTRCSLALDEIDTMRDLLTSDSFAQFCANNADAIKPRADVVENRKARRAAKAAAKADGQPAS